MMTPDDIVLGVNEIVRRRYAESTARTWAERARRDFEDGVAEEVLDQMEGVSVVGFASYRAAVAALKVGVDPATSILNAARDDLNLSLALMAMRN